MSNLVRNILLNTVELAEDIVADSSSIARAAGKKTAVPAPDVELVGWQELTLNLNALCSACNAILPKGSRAAMAVHSGPAEPNFRCTDCVSNTAMEDQE